VSAIYLDGKMFSVSFLGTPP